MAQVNAYIGLGSNEGDRLENLRRAVQALRDLHIDVTALSSVYETDPVGPPQPDFLNAVVEVSTTLDAGELYRTLKEIEQVIGRQQGERWGPRIIDLDLLLYGNEFVDDRDLQVPHPEMTKRAFVLVPLAEVSPDVRLPSGQLISSIEPPDPRGVRPFGKI